MNQVKTFIDLENFVVFDSTGEQGQCAVHARRHREGTWILQRCSRQWSIVRGSSLQPRQALGFVKFIGTCCFIKFGKDEHIALVFLFLKCIQVNSKANDVLTISDKDLNLLKYIAAVAYVTIGFHFWCVCDSFSVCLTSNVQ